MPLFSSSTFCKFSGISCFMCTKLPLIFELVVLLYILFLSETCPIGFIGAKFGIEEHSQGRAGVSARFYRCRKNHLENLAFGSLDRCPCNAQINPSRTAPKGAINKRERIKTQKLRYADKENDSRTRKALQHKPFPKLSPLRLYQGHEETLLWKRRFACTLWTVHIQCNQIGRAHV